MIHSFTATILELLAKKYQKGAEDIYSNSELLQYLNIKTKAANRGSKSRGSFGNLYASYVLVEDYLNKDFHKNQLYSKYAGAKYSDLLERQRTLPFGAKLQNHALNQRLNQEFKKYFPTCDFIPIIRDMETKRYWINENLLEVKVGKSTFNISSVIVEIIDKYVDVKRNAFDKFIITMENLKTIESKAPNEVQGFIIEQLAPNVDARIFEIVSFAILKNYYSEQSIYFGWTKETVAEEKLRLYKTGRTNANDGGIDFVMKPLGRFFQVTESTDVKKYFLDIDKLEKFPITFVLKSNENIEVLKSKILQGAVEQYRIESVVQKYMNCVEEIINIEKLILLLNEIGVKNQLEKVLQEIITQSKIEFNYQE
jgi:hypothetical protein